MGIFQRIVAWLTAKPLRSARKWDPYTNPVDIPKLARQLGLREEGARLGGEGVPLESATELTGPENQAVLAIEQVRSDYVEWVQLRLKGLNEELTRLDVTPAITAALESADEFMRQANADLTANSTELHRLAETARSRQEAFDLFQKINHRIEIPHYKKGHERLFKIVFAVFLAVFDGFCNATFFATGLSGGLIAGFFQAFIAASINVAACFAVGMVLVPLINHVNFGKKLVGFMSLALGLAFATILGLAVSHYREALISGIDTAQAVAMKTFIEAPFALNEVSSWLLFFLTVAFGVFAMWDGYSIDDPYPGYGKSHRRLLEAQDHHNHAISSLHDHLSQMKEQFLSQLQVALEQAETSIVRTKNVIADKERIAHDLTNAIGHAPTMLRALLSEFRDENIRARLLKGFSPPASFNMVPELKQLTLPNFDSTVDLESLRNQQRLYDEFVTKAPDVRSRIQAAFNANFSTVDTLSNQFSSGAGSAIASGKDATTAPNDGLLERA